MTIPTPPEKSEAELPKAILLSDLSIESLEAFDHFGIEAAAKLNKYAMAVEDALIEQVEKRKKDVKEIKRLQTLLKENNIPYEKDD